MSQKVRCSLLCWLLGVTLLSMPLEKLMPRATIGIIELQPNIILLFIISFSSFVKLTLFRKRYLFNSLDFAIALMAIVYFFIMLQSSDVVESGYLAMHSIFIPLLYYFSIKSIITSYVAYQVILRSITYGLLVLSVAVLVGFLTTFSRSSPLGLQGISAGTLLYMGIPIVTAIIYRGLFIGNFSKITITLSLIGTLTRAYFVMLIAFPFIKKQIRKGRLLIIGMGIFLATLLITIVITSAPAFLAPNEKDIDKVERGGIERVVDIEYWKEALYERTFTYNEGLANFKKNVLFGVGLYRGEINVTRHNLHIEWLEYGGLIGYLAYAGVFFAFFKLVRYASIKDIQIAGYAAAVIGILVNCVTNGIMHGLMSQAIFILMGLSQAKLRLNYFESLKNRKLDLAKSATKNSHSA